MRRCRRRSLTTLGSVPSSRRRQTSDSGARSLLNCRSDGLTRTPEGSTAINGMRSASRCEGAQRAVRLPGRPRRPTAQRRGPGSWLQLPRAGYRPTGPVGSFLMEHAVRAHLVRQSPSSVSVGAFAGLAGSRWRPLSPEHGVPGAGRMASSRPSPAPERGMVDALPPKPWPAPCQDGPDDPRDHHRDLGPGGLRLDGQQDQRPRRRRLRRTTPTRSPLPTGAASWAGSPARRCRCRRPTRSARSTGVNVVASAVMMLMDDQASAVTMGTPPMITGSIPGARPGARDVQDHYAEGRARTAADEGSNVTVLGSDIARKFDKHLGDTIDAQGRAVHGHRRPRADPHGARPGGQRPARCRPAAAASRPCRR